MRIICDTHIILFWADRQDKLTHMARQKVEEGVESGTLACSDISFWEIAMLFRSGKLNANAGISPEEYMDELVKAMGLTVFPITPEIAVISQSDIFKHKDPADRLIAATAIHHKTPLITADKKLRDIEQLNIIW